MYASKFIFFLFLDITAVLVGFRGFTCQLSFLWQRCDVLMELYSTSVWSQYRSDPRFPVVPNAAMRESYGVHANAPTPWTALVRSCELYVMGIRMARLDHKIGQEGGVIIASGHTCSPCFYCRLCFHHRLSPLEYPPRNLIPRWHAVIPVDLWHLLRYINTEFSLFIDMTWGLCVHYREPPSKETISAILW